MASREVGTGAPESAETAVLVVDDEPDVASVTATYLERHLDDVAVIVESGGDEALSAVSETIDCVVSDYEMPEVDGLELLRRIRDRRPDLPFILFTARGSEEIASEAISAGVTDYLQKGVGTDQYEVLANRIENAIARRESEAAAQETEARYQRLLESSPHAVGVHDGEVIVFANERLCQIVGADAVAEVEGEDPRQYVHDEDVAEVADRMRRATTGEWVDSWGEFRVVRPDGEVRRVESRAAPVRFDGTAASQFVLRDVTERRRHDRRIRALHEATRRLMTASDPAAVGSITVDIVQDVFDEPVACLWAFDPASAELVTIASSDDAVALAEREGVDPDAVTLPEWTVEMDVYRDGEPRLIEDHHERDDVITDALRTIFVQPIGGHGILTIGSTDPEWDFSASERDLVGILGRSVAAAMDRVGADTSNP